MSRRRKVKRKELESYLEDVEVFETPKVLLEQYPTTPHIAACMLHTIDEQYNELEGKVIGDLGIGCGVLSIGAVMMGASYVIGFDIDDTALTVCSDNIRDYEIDNVDLVQLDINSITDSSHFSTNIVDSVIMNPPFGTKHNAGIDVRFIEVALKMAKTSVYSLHKTSTREFLKKKACEWGVEVEVIAELRFNLSKTLKFHKKNTVDIEVDFIRFSHNVEQR